MAITDVLGVGRYTTDASTAAFGVTLTHSDGGEWLFADRGDAATNNVSIGTGADSFNGDAGPLILDVDRAVVLVVGTATANQYEVYTLTSEGGDSIYTADGTLTGNRTVSQGGNTLTISGGPVTITDPASAHTILGASVSTTSATGDITNTSAGNVTTTANGAAGRAELIATGATGEVRLNATSGTYTLGDGAGANVPSADGDADAVLLGFDPDTGVLETTAASGNIYGADGTLAGARTVSTDGNNLTITDTDADTPDTVLSGGINRAAAWDVTNVGGIQSATGDPIDIDLTQGTYHSIGFANGAGNLEINSVIGEDSVKEWTLAIASVDAGVRTIEFLDADFRNPDGTAIGNIDVQQNTQRIFKFANEATLYGGIVLVSDTHAPISETLDLFALLDGFDKTTFGVGQAVSEQLIDGRQYVRVEGTGTTDFGFFSHPIPLGRTVRVELRKDAAATAISALRAGNSNGVCDVILDHTDGTFRIDNALIGTATPITDVTVESLTDTYAYTIVIPTQPAGTDEGFTLIPDHTTPGGSAAGAITLTGAMDVASLDLDYQVTLSDVSATLINSSAGAVVETLPAATGGGTVVFFTNQDVTNTGTLAVASGESLNGVTDGTFLFSNYASGTQFRVDDVAAGEWVVSVVGVVVAAEMGWSVFLVTLGVGVCLEGVGR